ncbi:hypothetical protein AC249_AIPGENE28866 [Exaiptasia diaphana]|nr:hypothetical protein AC249_AIPGENE28866 [Exaiptasia diaphana]
MGGNQGHSFNGVTIICDNERNNFWHSSNSHYRLKYATVTLRRNPAIPIAGILTSTSCGTPTYAIKDIEVYF